MSSTNVFFCLFSLSVAAEHQPPKDLRLAAAVLRRSGSIAGPLVPRRFAPVKSRRAALNIRLDVSVADQGPNSLSPENGHVMLVDRAMAELERPFRTVRLPSMPDGDR